MFGGGGGGGLDPSKMKQMMKQMGIDIEDVDAEEVVIRTADQELVFTDAEVQLMEAQGQETYQVVGSPERRALGAGGETATADDGEDSTAGGDGAGNEDGSDGIPQDDVDLVAQRTGVSAAEARDALEATDGDLAAAVNRLE